MTVKVFSDYLWCLWTFQFDLTSVAKRSRECCSITVTLSPVASHFHDRLLMIPIKIENMKFISNDFQLFSQPLNMINLFDILLNFITSAVGSMIWGELRARHCRKTNGDVIRKTTLTDFLSFRERWVLSICKCIENRPIIVCHYLYLPLLNEIAPKLKRKVSFRMPVKVKTFKWNLYWWSCFLKNFNPRTEMSLRVKEKPSDLPQSEHTKMLRC